jgi:hypothetical protein
MAIVVGESTRGGMTMTTRRSILDATRVYIDREPPLMRPTDWDPIREYAFYRESLDDETFIERLREYAEKAALYAARLTLKDPGSMTDYEWFDVVISHVTSTAAAATAPPARTPEELTQRYRALTDGYLRLAALLQAWAAVAERRSKS